MSESDEWTISNYAPSAATDAATQRRVDPSVPTHANEAIVLPIPIDPVRKVSGPQAQRQSNETLQKIMRLTSDMPDEQGPLARRGD